MYIGGTYCSLHSICDFFLTFVQKNFLNNIDHFLFITHIPK